MDDEDFNPYHRRRVITYCGKGNKNQDKNDESRDRNREDNIDINAPASSSSSVVRNYGRMNIKEEPQEPKTISYSRSSLVTDLSRRDEPSTSKGYSGNYKIPKLKLYTDQIKQESSSSFKSLDEMSQNRAVQEKRCITVFSDKYEQSKSISQTSPSSPPTVSTYSSMSGSLYSSIADYSISETKSENLQKISEVQQSTSTQYYDKTQQIVSPKAKAIAASSSSSNTLEMYGSKWRVVKNQNITTTVGTAAVATATSTISHSDDETLEMYGAKWRVVKPATATTVSQSDDETLLTSPKREKKYSDFIKKETKHWWEHSRSSPKTYSYPTVSVANDEPFKKCGSFQPISEQSSNQQFPIQNVNEQSSLQVLQNFAADALKQDTKIITVRKKIATESDKNDPNVIPVVRKPVIQSNIAGTILIPVVQKIQNEPEKKEQKVITVLKQLPTSSENDQKFVIPVVEKLPSTVNVSEQKPNAPKIITVVKKIASESEKNDPKVIPVVRKSVPELNTSGRIIIPCIKSSVAETVFTVAEQITSSAETIPIVDEPTTSFVEPATSYAERLIYSYSEPNTSGAEQPITFKAEQLIDDSYAEPVTSYAEQPMDISYDEPTTSFAESITSYDESTTSYAQQPIDSYAEATTSYAEQTTSYAEPVTSYAEPSISYAEPTTSYAEPITSYAEPTTSYAESIPVVSEPTTSYAQQPTTSHSRQPIASYSGPITSYVEKPIFDYAELLLTAAEIRRHEELLRAAKAAAQQAEEDEEAAFAETTTGQTEEAGASLAEIQQNEEAARAAASLAEIQKAEEAAARAAAAASLVELQQDEEAARAAASLAEIQKAEEAAARATAAAALTELQQDEEAARAAASLAEIQKAEEAARAAAVSLTEIQKAEEATKAAVPVEEQILNMAEVFLYAEEIRTAPGYVSSISESVPVVADPITSAEPIPHSTLADLCLCAAQTNEFINSPSRPNSVISETKSFDPNSNFNQTSTLQMIDEDIYIEEPITTYKDKPTTTIELAEESLNSYINSTITPSKFDKTSKAYRAYKASKSYKTDKALKFESKPYEIPQIDYNKSDNNNDIPKIDPNLPKELQDLLKPLQNFLKQDYGYGKPGDKTETVYRKFHSKLRRCSSPTVEIKKDLKTPKYAKPVKKPKKLKTKIRKAKKHKKKHKSHHKKSSKKLSKFHKDKNASGVEEDDLFFDELDIDFDNFPSTKTEVRKSKRKGIPVKLKPGMEKNLSLTDSPTRNFTIKKFPIKKDLSTNKKPIVPTASTSTNDTNSSSTVALLPASSSQPATDEPKKVLVSTRIVKTKNMKLVKIVKDFESENKKQQQPSSSLTKKNFNTNDTKLTTLIEPVIESNTELLRKNKRKGIPHKLSANDPQKDLKIEPIEIDEAKILNISRNSVKKPSKPKLTTLIELVEEEEKEPSATLSIDDSTKNETEKLNTSIEEVVEVEPSTSNIINNFKQEEMQITEDMEMMIDEEQSPTKENYSVLDYSNANLFETINLDDEDHPLDYTKKRLSELSKMEDSPIDYSMKSQIAATSSSSAPTAPTVTADNIKIDSYDDEQMVFRCELISEPPTSIALLSNSEIDVKVSNLDTVAIAAAADVSTTDLENKQTPSSSSTVNKTINNGKTKDITIVKEMTVGPQQNETKKLIVVKKILYNNNKTGSSNNNETENNSLFKKPFAFKNKIIKEQSQQISSPLSSSSFISSAKKNLIQTTTVLKENIPGTRKNETENITTITKEISKDNNDNNNNENIVNKSNSMKIIRKRTCGKIKKSNTENDNDDKTDIIVKNIPKIKDRKNITVIKKIRIGPNKNKNKHITVIRELTDEEIRRIKDGEQRKIQIEKEKEKFKRMAEKRRKKQAKKKRIIKRVKKQQIPKTTIEILDKLVQKSRIARQQSIIPSLEENVYATSRKITSLEECKSELKKVVAMRKAFAKLSKLDAKKSKDLKRDFDRNEKAINRDWIKLKKYVQKNKDKENKEFEEEPFKKVYNLRRPRIKDQGENYEKSKILLLKKLRDELRIKIDVDRVASQFEVLNAVFVDTKKEKEEKEKKEKEKAEKEKQKAEKEKEEQQEKENKDNKEEENEKEKDDKIDDAVATATGEDTVATATSEDTAVGASVDTNEKQLFKVPESIVVIDNDDKKSKPDKQSKTVSIADTVAKTNETKTTATTAIVPIKKRNIQDLRRQVKFKYFTDIFEKLVAENKYPVQKRVKKIPPVLKNKIKEIVEPIEKPDISQKHLVTLAIKIGIKIANKRKQIVQLKKLGRTRYNPIKCRRHRKLRYFGAYVKRRLEKFKMVQKRIKEILNEIIALKNCVIEDPELLKDHPELDSDSDCQIDPNQFESSFENETPEKSKKLTKKKKKKNIKKKNNKKYKKKSASGFNEKEKNKNTNEDNSKKDSNDNNSDNNGNDNYNGGQNAGNINGNSASGNGDDDDDDDDDDEDEEDFDDFDDYDYDDYYDDDSDKNDFSSDEDRFGTKNNKKPTPAKKKKSTGGRRRRKGRWANQIKKPKQPAKKREKEYDPTVIDKGQFLSNEVGIDTALDDLDSDSHSKEPELNYYQSLENEIEKLVRDGKLPSSEIMDDGNPKFYKVRLDVYNKYLTTLDEESLMLERRLFYIDEDFAIPEKIWNRLFDYQREGVRWLCKLHMNLCGGILGDEMGLGKTVQIIAFLIALSHSQFKQIGEHYRGMGPVLLVCPVTVMAQWVSEFHKWWPQFHVSVLHSSGSSKGENKIKVIRETIENRGILITSFNSLHPYQDILLIHNWQYVILDEGHRIRNPYTQVSQICKRFETPHRIIMSGTPIQNSLREFWSLIDFVYPGKLGLLNAFENDVVSTINRGTLSDAGSYSKFVSMTCATKLRDLTSPYILRRSKDSVNNMLKLPPKSEQICICRLTEYQKDSYIRLLSKLHPKVHDQNQIERGMLFKFLAYARKICNHPYLFDKNSVKGSLYSKEFFEQSSKMMVLQALLKIWYAQKHRVLVFTQGVQTLDLIEKLVIKRKLKYYRMDGNTPIASRQSMMESFNTDESIFCFLLTTRVGGVGTTLTGANRVIIFDPDWNPCTDMQARERCWRIGQNRDVTIYRLLTAGTIEEKIYKKQLFKQFLSNQVLNDPKRSKFLEVDEYSDLFDLGDCSANSILMYDNKIKMDRKRKYDKLTDEQKQLSESMRKLPKIPKLSAKNQQQQPGTSTSLQKIPSTSSSLINWDKVPIKLSKSKTEELKANARNISKNFQEIIAKKAEAANKNNNNEVDNTNTNKETNETTNNKETNETTNDKDNADNTNTTTAVVPASVVPTKGKKRKHDKISNNDTTNYVIDGNIETGISIKILEKNEVNTTGIKIDGHHIEYLVKQMDLNEMFQQKIDKNDKKAKELRRLKKWEDDQDYVFLKRLVSENVAAIFTRSKKDITRSPEYQNIQRRAYDNATNVLRKFREEKFKSHRNKLKLQPLPSKTDPIVLLEQNADSKLPVVRQIIETFKLNCFKLDLEHSQFSDKFVENIEIAESLYQFFTKRFGYYEAGTVPMDEILAEFRAKLRPDQIPVVKSIVKEIAYIFDYRNAPAPRPWTNETQFWQLKEDYSFEKPAPPPPKPQNELLAIEGNMEVDKTDSNNINDNDDDIQNQIENQSADQLAIEQQQPQPSTSKAATTEPSTMRTKSSKSSTKHHKSSKSASKHSKSSKPKLTTTITKVPNMPSTSSGKLTTTITKVPNKSSKPKKLTTTIFKVPNLPSTSGSKPRLTTTITKVVPTKSNKPKLTTTITKVPNVSNIPSTSNKPKLTTTITKVEDVSNMPSTSSGKLTTTITKVEDESNMPSTSGIKPILTTTITKVPNIPTKSSKSTLTTTITKVPSK